MTVRLLFFAELRDLFGAAERTLNLPSGMTAREALVRCPTQSGASLPEGLRVRFAVNESYVEADTALAHGDTLAVLTPVSGG